MTSLNFFRNPFRHWFGDEKPTVPVTELRARDRRRMLRHFLCLEGRDRLLRFGSPVTDEQVTRYVQSIDFDRDMVFGVYNRVFKLVGVGHLAFAETSEERKQATEKDRRKFRPPCPEKSFECWCSKVPASRPVKASWSLKP